MPLLIPLAIAFITGCAASRGQEEPTPGTPAEPTPANAGEPGTGKVCSDQGSMNSRVGRSLAEGRARVSLVKLFCGSKTSNIPGGTRTETGGSIVGGMRESAIHSEEDGQSCETVKLEWRAVTCEDGRVIRYSPTAIADALAGQVQQNSGVQSPSSEPPKKFEVAMSASRLQDIDSQLVQAGSYTFLDMTGREESIDGETYEVVSVEFDPARYQQDQVYRTAWDFFVSTVRFYYDHPVGARGPDDPGGLLQENGLTISDLPEDLQGFLQFLKSPETR